MSDPHASAYQIFPPSCIQEGNSWNSFFFGADDRAHEMHASIREQTQTWHPFLVLFFLYTSQLLGKKVMMAPWPK